MKGFIPKETHPFYVLLLLIAFMIGGYFVGSFIFAILASAVFNIGIMEMPEIATDPASHPNGRNIMLMLQGVIQFLSFVVAPLFLLRVLKYKIDPYLNWKMPVAPLLVLLAGVLMIVIMPANSIIIHWNADMHFPDFLREFEQWARAKEDELAELTKMIANFDSVPKLLVGLLVIAVIPAIGEELVFRGILQKQLHRWTGNPHVAIWIAGLVFAAIHVQFFGFVPRAILGALFGYLYFWSGRISVPIVAHFFNNGFTVFMLYLQQTGAADIDVESTDPMEWYSILISVILSAGLLYYLYNEFRKVPPRTEAIPETAVDSVV
ncbi:CPBP family intramembrane metalloprotease [Pontibacter sp. KCTC 32443]|uniref:CPBP family intramembrane glutamic endopeptidase n=1 Tax=Pontibacter TaxID=323449 RepID=UPI00164D687D|nr:MULTISPECIES: CPBP family intramembrane glutamic endopeptidase [Pontibacter]MBC5774469.1 CPBP family intramembrane metalloprotease [Pontibacter sp. KCTC 32443]